jgi:hypothetical protein
MRYIKTGEIINKKTGNDKKINKGKQNAKK